MTQITNETFKDLQVGQKMIESCCSGKTFIKAEKISDTKIEVLNIDSVGFKSYCKVKKFNEEYDWLEPVNSFINADGIESSFQELKNRFLPKFSFGEWANDSCYIINNKTKKVVDTLNIINESPYLFSGKTLDEYELEW